MNNWNFKLRNPYQPFSAESPWRLGPCTHILKTGGPSRLSFAHYSGAQVRVLSAPPHFHFGQTNRTPEFLRKFPAGKVPAFEGDDGFCVFESSAIAYYVSNEELWGNTPEAAAQVVQWVSFADSDIVPPASTWVFPTLGIMHHNKQATENAKEEVRRILGLLDTHLKTRTFLVGERVTLADITVVCTLLWLYKQVLEPSFRQAFPNTNRWFLTCINQPQFWAVLGEVKLCEKMAQFDAKKFAESQPKKDTPRKEKGSREEKQKPQAERKEKKAAAPAPEEGPLLLRRKWMNVSRHWLLSQRPKTPLLTCPRVPLCWKNLSTSTPMRTLCGAAVFLGEL